MYHLVARTRSPGLLFATWREGHALWTRLDRALGRPQALVLMPNHVHVIHGTDCRRDLADALAGHLRSQNSRGSARVRLERVPPAELLADAQKLRRSIRYLHLNPCRARLVGDPLSWPFSTHRDFVGLAAFAQAARAQDVERFHRYVSSDPTVQVGGTALPRGLPSPTLEEVFDAVSAVGRVPVEGLRLRGPARTLFLQCATWLCPDATQREVGERVGVRRHTVARLGAPHPPTSAMLAVHRASGDPRLFALRGSIRESIDHLRRIERTDRGIVGVGP